MLAPFYHVGLVVPDLSRAMRDLSGTLGLTWAKEQRAELPVTVRGERVTRDLSFVYSVEGPPHVELIGANEPPWSLQPGLHHMGVWTENVGADLDALVADRYSVAARGRGFAYLASPTGLVVELVDRRSKAAFDGWIAGGDYL